MKNPLPNHENRTGKRLCGFLFRPMPSFYSSGFSGGLWADSFIGKIQDIILRDVPTIPNIPPIVRSSTSPVGGRTSLFGVPQ